MLNTVYRLTAPRKIEIAFTELDLFSSDVIVRPTYLSICHADQRYYQGTRDPKVLAKKLPMALIHEAIGEVVYAPDGSFEIGEQVVMIPNTPVEHDDIIAENYLRSSKFRASGFDGFMQEYVQLPADRLVRLPKDIDPHVAAFTELVSVSVHAISRFDKIAHARRNIIGVWGDGNLSYMTSVFLRKFFPDTKILIQRYIEIGVPIRPLRREASVQIHLRVFIDCLELQNMRPAALRFREKKTFGVLILTAGKIPAGSGSSGFSVPLLKKHGVMGQRDSFGFCAVALLFACPVIVKAGFLHEYALLYI